MVDNPESACGKGKSAAEAVDITAATASLFCLKGGQLRAYPALGGIPMCQARQVEITLRYFDGCPNWQTAEARVREALAATGHADVAVRRERVETAAAAERLAFVGSPTVLIDGRDPFETLGLPVGLACRIYQTPDGLAGFPTANQLKEVLR